MSAPRTLFDKVWDRHVVEDLGDGFQLLFIDRHLLNDMAGRGFITLNRRELPLAHPELTFAVADHTVATLRPGADGDANPYVANLRDNAARHGFKLFDLDDSGYGIIHVLAGEQGLALPGTTVACGDSHTCTLGAVGALGWGVGQSELVHVLATQTSVQRRPRTMRIGIDGAMPPGVTAKDVVLHLIGRLGVAGATGHAVEFAGPVVRAMSMEERFTLCNMAVELGARFGLVAPDQTTFAYLDGLPFAPSGATRQAALADWRQLASDDGATFDAERGVDVSAIEPQITWGTNPEQVVGISDRVPEPRTDSERRALDYAGLAAGTPIKGTPIHWVFIGSCTNSRLSDLRQAAALVRGKKVAPGVTAWAVAGSEPIRRAAEAEGLDQVFRAAGFGWGRPGCGMCASSGDQMREVAAPGQRLVSTTNRNFVGRQGPGTRTHLASPATAAASALAGHIADVRELET